MPWLWQLHVAFVPEMLSEGSPGEAIRRHASRMPYDTSDRAPSQSVHGPAQMVYHTNAVNESNYDSEARSIT